MRACECECVCVCVCVVLSLQSRLYEQVKLLGGQALGDLTVKTTHLICGEVQSLKYKVSIRLLHARASLVLHSQW